MPDGQLSSIPWCGPITLLLHRAQSPHSMWHSGRGKEKEEEKEEEEAEEEEQEEEEEEEEAFSHLLRC